MTDHNRWRPPVRERPILFSSPMVRAILAGTKTQTRRIVKPRHMTTVGAEQFQILALCPNGQPGSRLWVREAFIHEPADYCWEASVSIPCRPAFTVYRADHEGDTRGAGWKPSIHMPRWASRITLEITDVRVERLQDISEADAVAEGCRPVRPEIVQDGLIVRPGRSAIEEFRLVWEQIHGGGSWEKNPWVWVIAFKKLEGGECAT